MGEFMHDIRPQRGELSFISHNIPSNNNIYYKVSRPHVPRVYTSTNDTDMTCHANKMFAMMHEL